MIDTLPVIYGSFGNNINVIRIVLVGLKVRGTGHIGMNEAFLRHEREGVLENGKKF